MKFKTTAALLLAALAGSANAAIIEYDIRAGLDYHSHRNPDYGWFGIRDHVLTVDTTAGTVTYYSGDWSWDGLMWAHPFESPELPIAFEIEGDTVRLEVVEYDPDVETIEREPVVEGEYVMQPTTTFEFLLPAGTEDPLANLHLAETSVELWEGWNWDPAGYVGEVIDASRTIIKPDAPTSVPEPAPFALLGLGLAALGLNRRKI